jgi:hypothetical protein
MDERADDRDKHHHHGGESIDIESQLDVKIAGRHPAVERDGNILSAGGFQ